MPGKQDGPSRIICGPPRPPPNSPKCAFFALGPIYEKLVIIFFLVINLSALLWGLSALKFSFTWVRRKAPPQDPPNMKKSIIFSYFGFKLKNVLSDCFLIFHMYIDMGERIAGKQDRFSLIIEDPLRAPKIPPKYIFVSPVRSTYGGYYGLVVVTPRPPPPRPPRPQTLHRSHDNLNNPYRIASIFYM